VILPSTGITDVCYQAWQEDYISVRILTYDSLTIIISPLSFPYSFDFSASLEEAIGDIKKYKTSLPMGHLKNHLKR
jgi:hypothetical protein